MRDLHYPVRSFRIADKVHRKMKNKKPESMSWNRYFLMLMQTAEKNKKLEKERKNGL